MATRTGLEPVTSGVTGRHSNQLNYRAAKLFSCISSLFWRVVRDDAFTIQLAAPIY
jgi:hypothetical protein